MMWNYKKSFHKFWHFLKTVTALPPKPLLKRYWKIIVSFLHFPGPQFADVYILYKSKVESKTISSEEMLIYVYTHISHQCEITPTKTFAYWTKFGLENFSEFQVMVHRVSLLKFWFSGLSGLGLQSTKSKPFSYT